MKKIELHAHCAEGNGCSSVSLLDGVRYHAEAGYDVMVLTNHYNVTNVPLHGKSDEEAVLWYVGLYEKARAYGKTIGIDVWFGIETKLVGSNDDFLLYGAPPDLLYRYPRIYDLSQEALFAVANEFGALLLQAHPFRDGCHVREAKHMHGVEVYNGNPRREQHNEFAEAFAKENGLLASSGTDFHHPEDLGRGGAYIPDEISDEKMLVAYMRKHELDLIKT